MDELKPRPFCGGEGRVRIERIAEDEERTYVECLGCEAYGPPIEAPYGERETAIALWNERQPTNTE